MLLSDKTHAFIAEKTQKWVEFVKLLYFYPMTHPTKLLAMHCNRF